MQQFNEWNACIDFITATDENDVVCLVVIAEYFNDKLLPLLETIHQLRSIYLLCDDSHKHYVEWTKFSRKLMLIQYNSDRKSILPPISGSIRQKTHETIGFQTFRPQKDEVVDASLLNRLDASFMYSQLMKEIIIDTEVDYDEEYMDIFANACRAENQDNQTQLESINCFRNTYKEHPPVWWYTKESFLYSTLNKALRTQDITTILMMGFFIRDLHLQLIELQQTETENQSFSILYRGQGMTIDNFERLHQHIGGLLSFNNFLSTSSDYDVSLMYASSAADDSSSVSYYPHENEVLFSMHTVFRINDVSEIGERLWQIDLDFTDDQDEQLNVLLEHLRSEISIAGLLNVDRLGQLCYRMSDYDGALQIYHTLLQSFSDNFVLLSYAHQHLGLIYQQMDQLDQAIVHYKKVIDIQHSFNDDQDKERYLTVTYANLSTLYTKKGDLVQARMNCERALALVSSTKDNKEIDPVVYCYHLSNLAFIQRAEGKIEDSLDNYKKVVELRLQHLPSNHPDLSMS
ncbi:unnamed protein product [Rotaria sp. Silwood2]|nr:unnamed protein product [Rotaria sp. Silwood2]CAF3484316.1 unnamed protein product [Rotaria sp. Silwood2]CAF4562700.1 unnamed protein product [Rotaria sp. Silwood2]